MDPVTVSILTSNIYLVGFIISYIIWFFLMKIHMMDDTKLSKLDISDLAGLLFFPGVIAWLWPIVLPFASIVFVVKFFAKKLDI